MMKELEKTQNAYVWLSWGHDELAKHVPFEVRRDIAIHRTVNEMDPDFSYWRAVCAQRGVPDPGPAV